MKRNRLLLDVRQSYCYRTVSLKRNITGKHFIHCNTQRIDITFLITITTPRLLRTDIMYRTHGIGSDRIGCGCLGNSKIRNLYLALFGYNDILWLNIAVNNMVVMSCFHTLCDLNRDSHSLIDIKLSLFFDEFFQGNSFNQLHHDIIIIFILVNIIYIYYIRM